MGILPYYSEGCRKLKKKWSSNTYDELHKWGYIKRSRKKIAGKYVLTKKGIGALRRK